METVNIKAIQLDLKKPKLTTIGDFIQNDTNIIKFTLTENGSVIDLDVIDQILINYKKPSGEVISRVVTAEADVITYQLGFAEMSEAGLGKLVIQFFKSDNRISTFTVDVNIKKTVEGNFAFEETEKGLVDQVIQEINLVNTRIDNIAFDGVDTSKIATKEDLRSLATKSELSGLATKSELSQRVKTINGQSPDTTGNINISGGGSGLNLRTPQTGETFTILTENIPVTGITLNTNSITLSQNSTNQLTATISPSNATNKQIIWESSNTNIATVSQTGLVTALQLGNTTITARTTDGNFTAQVSCTVQAVSVTGVTITPNSFTLSLGGTQNLSAIISPTNATNKAVTWSSDNTSIATVSTSGVVTAVASGNTSITVRTVDGNFSATSTITVSSEVIRVTGVTLNKPTLTLTQGATETLIATIQPTNAANKNVTWSSNAEAIATVSTSGVVTALTEGSATITVTTADGGFTSNSTVNVAAAPTAPTTPSSVVFVDENGYLDMPFKQTTWNLINGYTPSGYIGILSDLNLKDSKLYGDYTEQITEITDFPFKTFVTNMPGTTEECHTVAASGSPQGKIIVMASTARGTTKDTISQSINDEGTRLKIKLNSLHKTFKVGSIINATTRSAGVTTGYTYFKGTLVNVPDSSYFTAITANSSVANVVNSQGYAMNAAYVFSATNGENIKISSDGSLEMLVLTSKLAREAITTENVNNLLASEDITIWFGG